MTGVNDDPPSIAEPKRYVLQFLTDQWEWEEEATADTVDQARAVARDALTNLIREEQPELACITLTEDGRKIGVWDWVDAQPIWSWF